MKEIKLTKRYPNSRTEDIIDAYMRGWNDALDAVQNGKFHIADTPQGDEFKNYDRGDLIALIEAQEERIGELLADRLQGEWSVHPVSQLFVCSACKDTDIRATPYCPNCGAKMKRLRR